MYVNGILTWHSISAICTGLIGNSMALTQLSPVSVYSKGHRLLITIGRRDTTAAVVVAGATVVFICGLFKRFFLPP